MTSEYQYIRQSADRRRVQLLSEQSEESFSLSECESIIRGLKQLRAGEGEDFEEAYGRWREGFVTAW